MTVDLWNHLSPELVRYSMCTIKTGMAKENDEIDEVEKVDRLDKLKEHEQVERCDKNDISPSAT